MLTAAPQHKEHMSQYNFLSRQHPFRSTESNFSEVSLVLCNLWCVVQQRIYQLQLYNVNEMKCAYGVAQWH